MILLDTNVVSEVMRPAPAQVVLDWFAGQVAADLYLPVIVEAELRFGILLLPDGRRREGLSAALEGMIEEDFAGRILPFDSTAARSYATIAAQRRRSGRAVKEADARSWPWRRRERWTWRRGTCRISTTPGSRS